MKRLPGFTRPLLVARIVAANRQRPDLAAIAHIEEPEAFVWAILPHAARTFAAVIALLPRQMGLATAVGYLYCRMLDTYEDLVTDRASREVMLGAFAARFADVSSDAPLAPAPAIDAAGAADRDDRDRAHLLLVERAALVDRVFATFERPVREATADLVREMAAGMQWSSRAFAAQGGVLDGEEQLAEYCRHVLGNPVVFAARMCELDQGRDGRLSDEQNARAMEVGVFTQLANVSRDIEKDLRRGVAYDASLRGDLGHDVGGDPAAVERVRVVRERVLRMAMGRARAYRPLIEGLRLPRFSWERAAAVVMLLFSERYYRGCARRGGLAAWPGPDSTLAIVGRGLMAAVSRASAEREMERAEREFVARAWG